MIFDLIQAVGESYVGVTCSEVRTYRFLGGLMDIKWVAQAVSVNHTDGSKNINNFVRS